MASAHVKMEGIARITPFKRANFSSAVDEGSAGEEEPAEKRQRMDSVRLPQPQTRARSRPPAALFLCDRLPQLPPRVAARGVREKGRRTNLTQTFFWTSAGLALDSEP